MQLYLIRHAKAKDGSDVLGDAERPLTKQGKAAFKDVVRRLDEADVRFDRVYHSPLLRAVETADLLEPLIDGETVVSPELAGPPRDALLGAIDGECVALVGHEPWLTELLFWLVTGWQLREDNAAVAPFRLEKGGVAVLDGTPRPGAMTLVALLPPELDDLSSP